MGGNGVQARPQTNERHEIVGNLMQLPWGPRPPQKWPFAARIRIYPQALRSDARTIRTRLSLRAVLLAQPPANARPANPASDVTSILAAIEQGDPHAAGKLWPLVYGELRKLAGARMAREQPGQTLGATALVHEAYLRLTVDSEHAFANRRHFFAAAAEAMRRILVENARRKHREKRGGGRRREFPDLDTLHAGGPPDEILALHEALERFADADPLKAQLVELRFFGGLTLAEAAECLDISLSAADRGWRYARAWLYAAMAGDDAEKLGEKS
jgi:RNA polymerase sigma factor (TIGR02999 family)